MIRTHCADGIDRPTNPIILCAICHQPIEDIGMGAVVYPDGGHYESDSRDVLPVHKGACHDQADARLGAAGGHWDELRDHLPEVIAGMGTAIPMDHRA